MDMRFAGKKTGSKIFMEGRMDKRLMAFIIFIKGKREDGRPPN